MTGFWHIFRGLLSFFSRRRPRETCVCVCINKKRNFFNSTDVCVRVCVCMALPENRFRSPKAHKLKTKKTQISCLECEKREGVSAEHTHTHTHVHMNNCLESEFCNVFQNVCFPGRAFLLGRETLFSCGEMRVSRSFRKFETAQTANAPMNILPMLYICAYIHVRLLTASIYAAVCEAGKCQRPAGNQCGQHTTRMN